MSLWDPLLLYYPAVVVRNINEVNNCDMKLGPEGVLGMEGEVKKV